MDYKLQKEKAQDFVDYWMEAKGSEDSECQQFWTDLCRNVLGIQNTTQEIDFERKVQGKKIDVFLENQRILIEQKSRGIDLDTPEVRGKEVITPYRQAFNYNTKLPTTLKAYWIITCNFDKFRFYYMNELDPNYKPEDNFVVLDLADLPTHLNYFDCFVNKSHTRLYEETELSIKAGNIVGELYELLSKKYLNLETDEREQKSLNILIVRLVFLMYAEDAALLGSKSAFLNYMKTIPANRFKTTLTELFKTLDTPEDERDPYLDEGLAKFPYINGGLFEDENIIIPQFDETMKTKLLLEASQNFNWAKISPTIFGAVFESTLNPETRRQGGMHYTSIENIHKVIDPLFLDDLKKELEKIEAKSSEKARLSELREYQQKLANIKVLDPAAGSHNFLTETYISLRKLENRVIENIHGNQQTAIEDPIKVNINQFYAIEINDFAVAVGKTAMWIAEQQTKSLTQDTLDSQKFEYFPLKNVVNSHCANALTTDWEEVISPNECDYIIGNPPFYGARNQTKQQKAEILDVFHGAKNAGNIDYVAGWYMKASEYIKNSDVQCAFVSTNSICQGEQVANIWKPIMDMGVSINFAYDTFRWKNEANDQAHVFCIIVGFSASDTCEDKLLMHHETPDSEFEVKEVKNINSYLVDAPNVFVWNISKPICNVPKIGIGNKPIDGGNYLFSEQEMLDFIKAEPASKVLFKQWLGSAEFIRNCPRYVLWLGDIEPEKLKDLPLCKERVFAVRDYRLASKSAPTRKIANKPTRFHVENIPDGPSIIIPETSSERRKYIPMGFVGNNTFCSNAVRLIPNATLYHFGILHSTFHNAWMRTVCGRLESRYRYSGGVVYNNYIWPGATKENLSTPVEDLVKPQIKQEIETLAQQILDIRDSYSESSLADMYNPDNEIIYTDLFYAHKQLDRAVEKAYGVEFLGDEEKIVSHLFNLYSDIIDC